MRGWGRIPVVVGVVGVVLAYPLLTPVVHRIDDGHFNLIHPGMTVDQVEAIFGVSAGSYGSTERVGELAQFKLSRSRPGEATYRVQTNIIGFEFIVVGGFSAQPVASPTWISVDGAYTFPVDEAGRVLQKLRLRGPIEPLWKRWWERFWRK